MYWYQSTADTIRIMKGNQRYGQPWKNTHANRLEIIRIVRDLNTKGKS